MWKIVLIFLTANSFATALSAQNYAGKFGDLFQKKDTAGQRAILIEWESKTPGDPELYTAWFNFYVKKSIDDIIILGNNPGNNESLQIKDSTGSTAGYLYANTNYNPKYLNLGFSVIDKGIKKFPNRLDMRFGKIHMLGKAKDYSAFTVEIIEVIKYSGINKNKWTWTNNEAVKDPRQFLLTNLQGYTGELFNAGNDQSSNIRQIANAILKLYPDHVESLSNLGVSYLLESKFNEALPYLLKAEKLSPADAIVLNNIAYAYRNLKDNQNAIKYYQKVVEIGNDSEKRFAAEQLKKLIR